ncbi:recombination protein RecR [Candidatus Peregrinibacteria bacterium CG22_combo_CG10-13_8_21_14_all_44_10]|nr:MAG: recombination protein RecR [Candidatus Peregrinibacteria bacterium CG2_30_44_17]PIP66000.1 MAG: recombination protein RecR [Candidatus Peregrinibacteria bacterium CG22_combo_CG10-13_8_21_14_all_44_10]PIX79855.1 MAG: recombination protein RecR [Candidatus Peregrinibacteria bacterium CG_4_10_14_3_um_filter_44_21]PJB89322.1 MAG: recombination protein RecR [Candidatus Peregrinibacteria bacterium CG_4_9_14_0_8_um_filter_44_15]
MAKYLPKNIDELINEFNRLPGIGPKTAQRLAFHILKSPDFTARGLSDALLQVKDGIVFCKECFTLATTDLCEICQDDSRDRSLVCVVEDPMDLIAIEKTGEYKGLYHVLHGAITPLDGIGPDELKMKELFDRASEGSISEIIVATNPSLEGEATGLYIARLLAAFDIKITRIARGLPSGGDLEYADQTTISRAMNGRTSLV